MRKNKIEKERAHTKKCKFICQTICINLLILRYATAAWPGARRRRGSGGRLGRRRATRAGAGSAGAGPRASRGRGRTGCRRRRLPWPEAEVAAASSRGRSWPPARPRLARRLSYTPLIFLLFCARSREDEYTRKDRGLISEPKAEYSATYFAEPSGAAYPIHKAGNRHLCAALNP